MAAESDGLAVRVTPSLRMALAVVAVSIGAATVMNALGHLVIGEVQIRSFDLDGPSGLALVLAAAVGAAASTAFAGWSGWWRHIWRDRDCGPTSRWSWVVLFVLVVQVLVALSLGAYAEHSVKYLVNVVASCALVGYSEELIYRGLVVFGLRASIVSDVRVLLISSAAFAVAHVASLASAVSMAVVGQILGAFVLGSTLYLTRRATRRLVAPMVLHAAYDLGVLVAAKPPSRLVSWSYVVTTVLLVILVPIAARRLSRQSPAVVQPSLLDPQSAQAAPTTALD